MQVDNTILTAENFVTGDPDALNATHVADMSAPDPLFGDEAPAAEETTEETTPDTPEATTEESTEGIEKAEGTEAEAPKQTRLAPERVQELETKYGKDIEDLINHYLDQRGIDLDVATASLTDLQQYRNEQLIQSQLNELRNDWGDDFDDRYEEVRKYFTEKLDSNPAFDTVEGARMIWARIAQQRGELEKTSKKPPTVTTKSRKTQPGAKSYKFRQSELMTMPAAEYAKRADEITQAYLAGQVLNDVSTKRR